MKTCTTLSDELHRNENASIRPGPFKHIQTMAVNVSIFFKSKRKEWRHHSRADESLGASWCSRAGRPTYLCVTNSKWATPLTGNHFTDVDGRPDENLRKSHSNFILSKMNFQIFREFRKWPMGGAV